MKQNEEIKQWKQEPGWAKATDARFAKISAGRTAMKANDDYLAGKVKDFKVRKQHKTKLSQKKWFKSN